MCFDSLAFVSNCCYFVFRFVLGLGVWLWCLVAVVGFAVCLLLCVVVRLLLLILFVLWCCCFAVCLFAVTRLLSVCVGMVASVAMVVLWFATCCFVCYVCCGWVYCLLLLVCCGFVCCLAGCVSLLFGFVCTVCCLLP